ncbi:MAG: hypothetical protein D6775_05065 [Caldilineae bacterium]|nr:MAG: hypothetical protein D6775_05065 [Caldilineae bacterium]
MPPSVTSTLPDYFACLLRIWHKAEEDGWRILVEDIHSEEKRSFTDLEQLMAYLQEKTTARG